MTKIINIMKVSEFVFCVIFCANLYAQEREIEKVIPVAVGQSSYSVISQCRKEVYPLIVENKWQEFRDYMDKLSIKPEERRELLIYCLQQNSYTDGQFEFNHYSKNIQLEILDRLVSVANVDDVLVFRTQIRSIDRDIRVRAVLDMWRFLQKNDALTFDAFETHFYPLVENGINDDVRSACIFYMPSDFFVENFSQITSCILRGDHVYKNEAISKAYACKYWCDYLVLNTISARIFIEKKGQEGEEKYSINRSEFAKLLGSVFGIASTKIGIIKSDDGTVVMSSGAVPLDSCADYDFTMYKDFLNNVFSYSIEKVARNGIGILKTVLDAMPENKKELALEYIMNQAYSRSSFLIVAKCLDIFYEAKQRRQWYLEHYQEWIPTFKSELSQLKLELEQIPPAKDDTEWMRTHAPYQTSMRSITSELLNVVFMLCAEEREGEAIALLKELVDTCREAGILNDFIMSLEYTPELLEKDRVAKESLSSNIQWVGFFVTLARDESLPENIRCKVVSYLGSMKTKTADDALVLLKQYYEQDFSVEQNKKVLQNINNLLRKNEPEDEKNQGTSGDSGERSEPDAKNYGELETPDETEPPMEEEYLPDEE